MESSKIIINKVVLSEADSLEYNLHKLRSALHDRFDFWLNFDKGVKNYGRSKKNKLSVFFFRILFFILLLPKYFFYLFNASKADDIIRAAEEALYAHYAQPKIKVRQFRHQCTKQKALYAEEIELIKAQITEQQHNLSFDNLGQELKLDIEQLIQGFEKKLQIKLNKFNFYADCESRLSNIEQQIEIKESLQASKQVYHSLKEKGEMDQMHGAMKQEFELYNYYGDLLEQFSQNLKKVEADKEEQMEALELNTILKQIDKIEVK